MTKPISLEDLYTDTGAFDQQKVLGVLHTKIAFTRDNAILFVTDPSRMKSRSAVLLYALAKKVLKAGGKIEDESVNNAEILGKTKLNKNTVNVTIMRLKDKGVLIPSSTGYEVPMFKVDEALTLISTNKEE